MLLALIVAYSALPIDAEEYTPAVYTQSLYRLNENRRLDIVPISKLEDKWHRSGGMTKDTMFTSRKYRSGGKPKYELAPVAVENSFGFYQNEIGLTRTYPDGARFDDILYGPTGNVFEHRVREKKNGKWSSRVEYKDTSARPKDYVGLNTACSSCHDQAGTGLYGVGLVPGGDTVLSDPMKWSVAGPGYIKYDATLTD